MAEDLGWPERFPGIGWALGVDRTLLALTSSGAAPAAARRAEVFVVVADGALAPLAFALATELRRAGVATDMGFDGRSLKAQFKVADRSGARAVVVVGADELERGMVTVKDLGTGEQREVDRAGVVGELAAAAGT